jgi:ubiquinone biosynthesis protein COQ9
MAVSDRTAARDAAILATLPLVPQHGWTLSAVRAAAGQDADLLFPNGPAELVEAYIDLANREMVRLASPGLLDQKLPARVRALIETRLEWATPHREAVRRAASVLALPVNAATAARCTAGTVDAIWHAAGDRSADFSWYTKRAILASVYVATLFYWLNTPDDLPATLAFLDRRLAGISRIGKLRRRLGRTKAA